VSHTYQETARKQGLDQKRDLQTVAQAFLHNPNKSQERLQKNWKCHEAGQAYVKFTGNQPIQTPLPASSER
jgi:hypothetical protein